MQVEGGAGLREETVLQATELEGWDNPSLLGHRSFQQERHMLTMELQDLVFALIVPVFPCCVYIPLFCDGNVYSVPLYF